MCFVIVPPDYPKIDVAGTGGPESDPGPFPVPDIMPIEGLADQFKGSGDRHAIVVDPVAGMLYEFYRAYRTETGWKASGSAVFDLKTNRLSLWIWVLS